MSHSVTLTSGIQVTPATSEALLGTYLTSSRSRGTRNAGMVQGNKELKALTDAFVKHNPAVRDLGISPITSSSKDHGFLNVANKSYYDAMDEIANRDSTVAATLEIIESDVMTRDEHFEVTDEDDPQISQIIADCDKYLIGMEGNFTWNDLRSSLLMGTILHGFSVCEGMFELIHPEGRDLFVPRSYPHRHPGQFAFDELGNLFVMSPDGRNHRGQVKVIDDNGIVRIGDYIAAPPNKYARMRSSALYANPFGKSSLYALRFLYLFKREMIKAWILYNDNYGTPMVHGQVQGDDETDELMTELEDKLEAMKSSGGIVTSEKFKVEFIDRMAGMKVPPYPQFIDWASREEVRLLHGAVLGTMENEKTGSLAQAKVHNSVSQTRMKPMAKRLQDSIQHDAVAPFVRLNYGDKAQIPLYKIKTDDSLDVKTAIETIMAAGDAGMDVLKKQGYEMLGLTAPGDDDDIITFISNKEKAAPEGEGAEIVDPMNVDPEEMGLQFKGSLCSHDGKFETSEESSARINNRWSRGRPVTQAVKGAKNVLLQARSADVIFNSPVTEAVKKFQMVRSTEQRFLDRQQEVAGFVAETNRENLQREMDAWINELRQMDQTAPVGATAMASVPDTWTINEDADTAFTASKALAAWINYERITAEIPEKFKARLYEPSEMIRMANAIRFAEDPFEQIPGEFRVATEWMVDRDVMTRDEITTMAKALHALDPSKTVIYFERTLRDDLIALALTTNKEIIRRVRDTLASSVAEGKSLAEFIEVMDEFEVAGQIPIVGDGYLENVYRTETSLQYAHQRDVQMSDPDIAQNHWGDELFNPKGTNSRKTHREIDGLFLKRGSAAYFASKDGPPWSYQCLCARSPIIVADPSTTTEFAEPDDALSRVMAIERFS